MKRKLYLASVLLVALAVVAAQPAAAASVSWSTASDWDNASSESGVVHEDVANTDHDDAGKVQLGYSYGSPSSELDAWYPLHEDSGSTAYDVAGTNDGAVQGSPTQGQTGILSTSSYSFDGIDDKIKQTKTLSNQTHFSVAFWMKTTASTDAPAVSTWGGSEDGATGLIGGVPRYSSSGEVTFSVRDGSSDHHRDAIQTESSYNDGNWHHVVLVRSGTGGPSELDIYVDGKDVATTATQQQGAGSDLGTDSLQIGYSAFDPNYYSGSIAGVRLYDGTVLTESGAKEIANPGEVSGYLETKTESFVSPVKPSLSSTATLNGGSIEVDVVGSPGTVAEETQTVSLNGGGGPYDISWNSGHSDFQLNVSASTSDITSTPSYTSLSLSAAVSNAYDVNGSVTDSNGGGISGIVVHALNQSSNSVEATTTTGSNGDYSLSLTNSTYTIRAYETGYSAATQSVIVDGSDISGVDLSPTTDAPNLDDSSASPDDEFVGTSTTTLSINVDDAQFGSLGSPGEEVTVEFFDGADNSLGSDTLTSAGTASVNVNTPSEWYATATDATGLSDTSATFGITSPPDITIFNESTDQIVSTDVTLDIESLDSSYSTTQTISDGSGTLDAPGEERLYITATASGYVDRGFLLTNYTRDYPIVMLPTQDADSVRYEQCFDLIDNTGKFDAPDSYAIIQTEVNSTQTQYKGMVSSGFFGSSNLHCAFLVDQKPYTLSVQNTDGDMHRFGDWIAQDNGQTYTLEIGSLEVISSDSDADEKGRFFAVAEQTDVSPPRLKTEYFDRSANTSEIHWEIYKVNESGRDTLLESSNASGRFGQFADSYVLKDSLMGSTFRVEWTAYDNGTAITSGSETTGSLEDIDLPISGKWLQILSVIFIVAMGGLLVPSQPRLAAVVMALSATMLTMVGWIAIPTWALAPAVSTALLYQVAGVSGRI
jgi:hypothetical protein